MSDLISRSTLHEELVLVAALSAKSSSCKAEARGIRKAMAYVRLAPAVDAVPVVHGEWVEGAYLEKCSICGKKGFPDWRCCPNCGAKMDGGEEDG